MRSFRRLRANECDRDSASQDKLLPVEKDYSMETERIKNRLLIVELANASKNEEIKSLKNGDFHNEDNVNLLYDLIKRFAMLAKFELRIKTLEDKTEPVKVDMIDTQDQNHLKTDGLITSKKIGHKSRLVDVIIKSELYNPLENLGT